METTMETRRHIAPLAILRIAFGTVMLVSTLRFLLKGWVDTFYIAPAYHFTFYGFGWIKPLSPTGMYAVFAFMALSSLFILIGFLYRPSVLLFLVCFLYTELLDKTYYLNHYYFVSLIAFLLLLVPANRYISVDVLLKPSLRATTVPAWTILIFQAQLCLVYTYAGLSKLTHDWLLEAMPLRIWLHATDWPFLRQTWMAYAFSWGGAIFDLSISGLLFYPSTRRIAYVCVVIFHVLTGWLFKIGMFPYIMIAVTLIFFSGEQDLWLIRRLPSETPQPWRPRLLVKKLTYAVLTCYFLVQLLLPLRFLLYPGRLLWTEEGFRFSWRVMLMEKSGTAFFYVRDPRTGRRGEVDNRRFLTPLQERMMATQPDMILQYAHYLRDTFRDRGIPEPVVTVEDYVTLNGSGSRLYIDSTVDLSREHEGFSPKTWILPYPSKAAFR
jgi:hypothetical protein